MKLKELLKKSDYMSVRPTLFSKENFRYKTWVGGLFQVIIVMLYASCLIHFSKDIYFRENPIVIEYKTISKLQDEWILTQKDFSFIYALLDPTTNKPYYNESIYKVEFYQVKNVNGENNVKLLKSGQCSIDNFSKLDRKYFFGVDLSNYACIDSSEQLSLKNTLQTSPDKLQMKVYKCNTTEVNNMCSSGLILSSKLKVTSSILYYLDKNFDPFNNTDPFKYTLNTHTFSLSEKLHTWALIYLNKIMLQDDMGFIFQQLQSKEEIKTQKIERFIDLREVNEIFSFDIVLSEEVSNYYRKYEKIQNILAHVGGLIATFLIIFQILVSVFSEYDFLNKLSNDIFNEEYSFKQISQKKLIIYSKMKENFRFKMIGLNNSNFNLLNIANSPVQYNSHIKEECSAPFKSFYIKKINSEMKKKFIKNVVSFDILVEKIKEIEILKLLFFSPEFIRKFNSLIKSKNSTELIYRAFNNHDIINLEPESNFDTKIDKLIDFTEKLLHYK